MLTCRVRRKFLEDIFEMREVHSLRRSTSNVNIYYICDKATNLLKSISLFLWNGLFFES